jgi:hypothetical protein
VRLHADREGLLPVRAGLHGRRAREDEDRHGGEEDGRDDRPDHLEPRVPMDLRALVVLGHGRAAPEADDEEDERRLDEHEDDRAEGEDDPVDLVDGLAAPGDRVRRSDAARGGPSGPRPNERRDQRDEDGGEAAPEHGRRGF